MMHAEVKESSSLVVSHLSLWKYSKSINSVVESLDAHNVI